MQGNQITPPDLHHRPEEECDHRQMEVINDCEGDLDEARLTRYFTLYRCEDCGYESESPPPGWEPPFDEPCADPDEPPRRHY